VLAAHTQIVVFNDKLITATRDQLLLPPSYTRLLEYSPATDAVFELALDGGASIVCHEGLHAAAITCCIAPTVRVVATGSADGLVCVWALSLVGRQGGSRLMLRKRLHGHHGPVRAMAACPGYSILVTGSDDGACMMWDMAAGFRVCTPHCWPSCLPACSPFPCCIDTRLILHLTIVVSAPAWPVQRPHWGAPHQPAVVPGAGVCRRYALCVFHQRRGPRRPRPWRGVTHPLVHHDRYPCPPYPCLPYPLPSPASTLLTQELSEWAADGVIVTGHRDGRVRLWQLMHERSQVPCSPPSR
jgi:WD40 repeat protein